MGGEVKTEKLVPDSWPLLGWTERRKPSSTEFDPTVKLSEAGAVLLQRSRIHGGEAACNIHKAVDMATREDRSPSFKQSGQLQRHWVAA